MSQTYEQSVAEKSAARRRWRYFGYSVQFAALLGVMVSLPAEGLYWLKHDRAPPWSFDWFLDRAGYVRESFAWTGLEHLVRMLFAASLPVSFGIVMAFGWLIAAANSSNFD